MFAELRNRCFGLYIILPPQQQSKDDDDTERYRLYSFFLARSLPRLTLFFSIYCLSFHLSSDCFSYCCCCWFSSFCDSLQIFIRKCPHFIGCVRFFLARIVSPFGGHLILSLFLRKRRIKKNNQNCEISL